MRNIGVSNLPPRNAPRTDFAVPKRRRSESFPPGRAIRIIAFEKPHLPPGTGRGKGIRVSNKWTTPPSAVSKAMRDSCLATFIL
jgi:hypothetical protein